MYTKDEILKKCKDVHGDKYIYTKLNFDKVTDKVTIICPEHGEFTQELRQHYRGQGCPICGINKRAASKTSTTEKYIEKANIMHNGKYIYTDETVYVNSRSLLKVVCPLHGQFEIRANSHLNGQGCPVCGNLKKGQSNKLDNEKYISKANAIHNGKYIYTKLEYRGGSEKVCIICPEHGEFWQEATSHLMGSGCPKCALKNNLKDNIRQLNNL